MSAPSPQTAGPGPDGPHPERGRFVPGRGSILLLCLACGVLAFVLYAPAVNNELVWDDPIVLGQQLQAFHSMSDPFFPPPRIPQFGLFYYRPMITLSYMVDRTMESRVWKDQKVAFHVPVILFHALNTIFVLLIGRRLFGAGAVPLAAALAGAALFAAHPIHTESVCWMAGRSDTMAALFVLPAILAYWGWVRGRSAPGRFRSAGWLALAALLVLAGLLSKESAIGIVAVLMVSDLLGLGGEADTAHAMAAERAAPADPGRQIRGSPPRRRGRKEGRAPGAGTSPAGLPGTGFAVSSAALAGWAALGAAVLAYAWLRQQGLRPEGGTFRRQVPEFLDSLVNLVRALGFYLSKIFVPVNLDAYIPKVPNPRLSLVLGAVGLAAAAACAALAWKRRERLVLFLVAWFAATLAPSLAIAWFSISEAPVAERYLYLPSVAFCLLAGYLLIVRLPGWLPASLSRLAPYAAAAAVLFVGAAYAVGTVRRGEAWRSDLEFWKESVARSPQEGLPRLHLGLAYAAIDEKELAEKEYVKALDPSVDYDTEGRSIALNNLGMLYMGRRELDRADEYFRKSIDMRPDYATPHYGLGVTAINRADRASREGRGEEARERARAAEQHLRRAIQLNPQYMKAHNQLSYLLLNTGRSGEAREHVDLVLRLTAKGAEHDFAVRLRDQMGGSAGR